MSKLMSYLFQENKSYGVVEAGRMHVNVMVCEPAAWLTATRALRPLSMQRPYSAKKSATEADGGVVLGLAGSPTQVAVPPLTMLAHMGEAREVGGRGDRSVC
jgi:hypothetical protein